MFDLLLILMGLAGYILLLFYDLASIAGKRNRSILAPLGYGIHVVAIIGASAFSSRFSVPEWTILTGWFSTFVGGFWLLYCLFLFPPIAPTYRESQGPVLTTEGPYAFSRHPGVLGHALLVIGLVLVSRSGLLLVAALIWIPANVIYVLIQDRWLFPQLFPEYPKYRQQVPMLLPNAESMRRFWQTKY